MKDKNILEKSVEATWKFYQGRSEKTRKIIAQRVFPVTAIILSLFALTTYALYNSYTRENLDGFHHYTLKDKVVGSVTLGVVLTLGISFWLGLVPYVAYLFFRKKPFASEAHGSARFATEEELSQNGIIRSQETVHTEDGWQLQEGEFYVGTRPDPRSPKNKSLICTIPAERTARHIKITGSTGSGKTVNLVIPNILLANRKNESLFITDVKGELWDKTSGHQNFGIYFSPLEPDKNMLRFNWLPAMKENPTLAERFAQAVVFNRSEQKDSHWAQSAVELLQSVWLHTATTKTPSPLLAYEILFAPVDRLRQILETSPSRFAREAARQYLDAPEKEAGSILSTTRAAYKWLRVPELKEFCNRNDATDFTILRTGVDGVNPKIYYQAREDEVELLKPLNALIFTYLTWQVQNMEGNTVKFLLEEFGNFGKIPNFEKQITLMRSRKMPAIVFLQGFRSQLDEIYGKTNATTILSSLNTKIAFGGLDFDDAEFISERLGEFTNVSEVPDHEGRKNLQLNARRLATADEVTRMAKDMILVYQSSELHPFQAWRDRITEEYKRMSEQKMRKISGMTRKAVPNFDLSEPPARAQQPMQTAEPPMPEMPNFEEDWADVVMPGDENEH